MFGTAAFFKISNSVIIRDESVQGGRGREGEASKPKLAMLSASSPGYYSSQ